MEKIIELKNVDAGYPGVKILENVTFDVFKGEIFILFGGSGCGKSTVMKHMIGLNPVLGGQIAFCVDRYSESSTMEQLDLRSTKAIVDNMKKIIGG